MPTTTSTIAALLLAHFVRNADALSSTAPSSSTTTTTIARPARPVIVGTSHYSNVLFGKAQRAASFFGANVGLPYTVARPCDSPKDLERTLWREFCMADPGSDGVLEEADFVRPLSSWIPQADVAGDLLFLDAVGDDRREEGARGGGGAKKNKKSGDGGFDPFGFFGKKKTTKSATPQPATTATPLALDSDVLSRAAERGCAHVYVLTDDARLEGCVEALSKYCGGGTIPSTVLCLAPNVRALRTTDGWISRRPQNLDGELIGDVRVSDAWDEGRRPESLPAEDVAEVMLQIAMRTDRGLSSSSPDEEGAQPRVVYVQGGDGEATGSWVETLSSLGEVDGDLGKRPDVY